MRIVMDIETNEMMCNGQNILEKKAKCCKLSPETCLSEPDSIENSTIFEISSIFVIKK